MKTQDIFRRAIDHELKWIERQIEVADGEQAFIRDIRRRAKTALGGMYSMAMEVANELESGDAYLATMDQLEDIKNEASEKIERMTK